MLAGRDQPRWKALRARVFQDGQYGTDLFTPNVTNIDDCIARALRALGPAVETVVFDFDEKSGSKNARTKMVIFWYDVYGGSFT